MKKVLFVLTITILLFYVTGIFLGQLKLIKANACVLYTRDMNYYCVYKASEKLCNEMVSKEYYGEEIIKVWFYCGKYCREFGFKTF